MRMLIASAVLAGVLSSGGCAALDRMTPEQREATAAGVETGAQAAAGAVSAFPGVGWVAAPIILAVGGLVARVIRTKPTAAEPNGGEQ